MAESDQVSLIWSRAINQYQAITKKKLDGSILNSVATVDDLVKVIEEENNDFADFRSKRHDLFTVLKYAMIPVELVGKVVASGAGQAFWPCALVFSGVKLLLEAAKGVSSKYDAIIELMSSLKVFIHHTMPSFYILPGDLWITYRISRIAWRFMPSMKFHSP